MMNEENKDNKEKLYKIEELLKQEIAKRKELEENGTHVVLLTLSL